MSRKSQSQSKSISILRQLSKIFHMFQKAFFRVLITAFCLSFIFGLQAELKPIPNLQTRVTDTTGVLGAQEIASIEQSLKQLEQEKGAQVAVLLVGTTSPEAIEDYSLRVVEKWKLGRKGRDDGVLLLIAMDDRKMRIEVGYGLEGAIPDISAGRIINEFITPEFRKQNYTTGILSGVDKIASLLKGEALPPASSSQGVDANSDTIFFLIFASTFVSSFLTPFLGRLLTASVISVGGGLIIWFLSQDIIFTIFAIVFLAVLSMAFGNRNSSYRDGGGYGGGFGGGGSYGGGGGFSGGGGSFGGGGASGGW